MSSTKLEKGANNGVAEYEEYLNHVQDAERSLSQALDCLYKPDGITRGLAYRLRLGRAQNSVMTLLVREISHREGYSSGGIHEYERVDTGWECVFCEKQTKPRTIGKRIIFAPNVLRRIPLAGRRWRCDG